MKKILQKLNSIRLCMEAHPHNEPGSEFADRIEDLKELPKMIEEYTKNLELQIDIILSGSSHDLQNEYADKWIKMESEEDLPKEENDYWVIDKDGIVSMDVWENLPFTDMNRIRNRKWVEHYSHYTPLIIPKPPKEY